MSDLSDVEANRKNLEWLCRNPKTRTNWPLIQIERHRWQPYSVTEPSSLSVFTDDGAWEFIADCLRAGAPVSYKPPSEEHPDHAYVMVEAPAGGDRRIYMKVAIRPGLKKIIGISFHYERHT